MYIITIAKYITVREFCAQIYVKISVLSITKILILSACIVNILLVNVLNLFLTNFNTLIKC